MYPVCYGQTLGYPLHYGPFYFFTCGVFSIHSKKRPAVWDFWFILNYAYKLLIDAEKKACFSTILKTGLCGQRKPYSYLWLLDNNEEIFLKFKTFYGIL